MFNAAGNSGKSVFACAHCWLKAEAHNQRSWQVDRQLDTFDNYSWKRQVSQNLCQGCFWTRYDTFSVCARAFCVLNLNMFNAAGNSGKSVFACAHCWLKAEAHNQRSWQVDRQLDNFDNYSWKRQVSQNLCQGCFWTRYDTQTFSVCARAFCVLNLNMFNAAGNSGKNVFACAHCWLKAEGHNQRSWQVDRQLDNFDNCSWKRQVSQNLCKGAFGLDMIHFLFVLEHSASWTWICSMPRETLARVSLLVPIADWNAEAHNQRSWQVDRQLDNFDNCSWKRQVSQNLCKGAFGLDMIHFLFVLEHSASWTWICSMPRETLARVSLLVPIADWKPKRTTSAVDKWTDNWTILTTAAGKDKFLRICVRVLLD